MTAAMILGAGHGTRLRPLTALLPKALVPVGLEPLLDRHLDTLAAVGANVVALNASHLADQVERHVGERGPRLPRVEVIREELPLDTGGGLLGARALLEREARFLVVNVDAFHEIELGAVLETHDRSAADATLAVRRAGEGEPQDVISITAAGTVSGIAATGGTASGWRFIGVQVLSPPVFDHLTAPGSLVAGYEGLLAAGAKIVAHDCGDATWFDVGTPRDYLEANRAAIAIASKPPPPPVGVEVASPVLVATSARIGEGCVIGPSTVIGDKASIGPGARLAESVVWPEVSVPAGAELRRCVAHPGGILRVPAPT